MNRPGAKRRDDKLDSSRYRAASQQNTTMKGTAGSASAGKKEERDESDSEDDEMLQRTQLDLSSNPLPPVAGLITAMQRLRNLQKLDLSSMLASGEAGNPDGLDSLEWLGKAIAKSRRTHKRRAFGHALTWIKFSGNKSLGDKRGEHAWKGMDQLSNLIVLNASSCALPVAPPASTLLAWTSLAALVLGHNDIKRLEHFPSMPQLNTLVLSHNKITSLPRDLPASLPALKKLSMTHNDLHWQNDVDAAHTDDEDSPLPDFALCSHLREVRISGNANLRRLPDHLQNWGKGVGSQRKGTGLEMLEAGDCGFASLDAIAPLLKIDVDSTAIGEGSVHPSRRRVRGITTLLLKGNLVALDKEYRKRLLETHPALRVLDNEKLYEPTKTGEVLHEEQAKALVADVGNARRKSTLTARSAAADTPAPSIHRPPKPLEQRPFNTPKQIDSARLQGDEERAARKEHKARTGNQSTSRDNGSEQTKTKSAPKDPRKEQSAFKVADEPKKPRKRGSRGKSKGKGEGEVASAATKGDPFLIKAVPEEERVDKRSKGENRNKLPSKGKNDRTDSRGVVAKKAVLKKEKGEKTAGNSGKERKRKAWDEQEGVSERKAPPAEIKHLDDAGKGKPDKDLTAVAGIVNVQPVSKRRKTDDTVVPPKAAAWGQRHELTLGLGGAWT